VKNLRVAWSLTLPAGANEATPLVHDGVIFVHSFGDNVQALDAATGDELWHYSRKLPENVRPAVKKNMALYSNKLFVGTSDIHVVALDVKTGSVVWDQPITNATEGWQLTGGPLVAKGKVMQGIGGRVKGGAYIVGLDSETGKEAWRFHSIARPGEPGGDTWNGIPLNERSGGSIWTAPSYDPALNLVFFGPAPTYDTGPLRNRVSAPGVTNDALYTNSTVALNPDNGKLVWYYQHMPNDQWDFDWAFERQIVPLRAAGGQTKKFVVTSGKPGIYDAVEADTGKYAFSVDMGLQNFVTSIDPATGAKRVDPNLIPGTGQPIVVCPHAGGGRSWIPGAINPDTKMLFVPAVETCMNLIPTPAGGRGFLTTGVAVNVRPRPDSDGRYGRLQAINLETKKTIWTERQRAPQSTGVLATAGGVVFAGALDRWLTAYDDANGKNLWRVRLNDVPNSVPISYTANGKQYVAVVVGYGGAQVASFPQLTPEIPLPVTRSAAIWAFELP
jgi:PQQ-dependent dehydrogenase (methanol/ethanol family)